MAHSNTPPSKTPQSTIHRAEDVVRELRDGKPSAKMPVMFVGHGNPMNAVTDNAFSREWAKIGKELTVPRAIICMSAHWLTKGSFITAMPNPITIHDFFGFPDAMYDVKYPAPGDPPLASEVCQIVKGIEEDHEWGLDHGAWSFLVKMFPHADIPVLQLSVDYSKSPEQQYGLTRELTSLREKGVLFIGSGNIVHNLRAASFDNATPYDWALEFDAMSKKLIETGDHQALVHYKKLGRAADMSIPTDEHYRPMLTTLALSDPNERVRFFNEAIDAASISMRSFILS